MTSTPPPPRGALAAARKITQALEDGLITALFAAMALLPLLEALSRSYKIFNVPGNAAYLQQAVLWMAFLGGALAMRDGKHLQLSTTEALPPGRPRRVAHFFAYTVAGMISTLLVYTSAQLVAVNREAGAVLTIGLPEWISDLVMPIALGWIALRFALQAHPKWWGRAAALALLPAGFLFSQAPQLVAEHAWALTTIVLAATLVGAPVFTAMAAIAMIFFFQERTPISAVSADMYQLITSSAIPAVPLLTATGYILAESKAASRLVRFFRAIFGWMPGGVAILVAGVCAVFTTFTGGSGVTIIALGGLVYGILQENGYDEGFSLGLVAAGGSLGLLFPPSLPVILYAVVAQVPADSLYLAGILPGMLLVMLVAAYGIFRGARSHIPRAPFDPKEILAATWEAKWELSVPVIVIALFASGLTSMVEASAVACLYAVIIEVGITRDIHPIRELPGVLVKSGALIGAVLLLLAAAMGLSGYLVDAEIPDHLLAWMSNNIHSPWVFLLILNGLLLVLGSVLEIYSAIVILPPILAPIAAHYGINPIHMGVIFLANLELGFLFPPVGLNLFLTSTRFNKPMFKLYKYVIPYLLILGVGVLVITYVPSLSMALPEWIQPQKIEQIKQQQVENFEDYAIEAEEEIDDEDDDEDDENDDGLNSESTSQPTSQPLEIEDDDDDDDDDETEGDDEG
ncbi:TRAP transporter large permease subunit [Myxococcota bacterium]|nr:TRAP transporter large permease subunit [Myxococcota bacterium]MBU1899706.1 TRAP transporter large permease subunit [Myxococcota bacterium]